MLSYDKIQKKTNQEKNMSKNRFFRTVLGAGIILSVIAVFIWGYYIRLPLPCLFYRMTGMLCPTCGATRAVISLVHGDFLQAFKYNAFVAVTFIPITIWIVFTALGIIINKKKWYDISIKKLILILILIGIFIIFGIIRNV